MKDKSLAPNKELSNQQVDAGIPIKDKIRDNIEDEIKDKQNDKTRDKIKDKLKDEIEDRIKDEIGWKESSLSTGSGVEQQSCILNTVPVNIVPFVATLQRRWSKSVFYLFLVSFLR